MIAAFSIPETPVDLQALHLLRACQALFEREVQRGMANAADAADAPAPPSPDAAETPLPAAAITAGRQCVMRIGDTHALAPVELPFLVRLAVGINDDTLVQQVVTRQLARAGGNARDRGHVLETAIHVLLHNQWLHTAERHRTPAHDALARGYAAQLDTLQPAGQVLASRLRVASELQEIAAPAVWNVDDDLAWERAYRQLALSVPLRMVAPEDTADVHRSYGGSALAMAWLTFLKTPAHAMLAHWIAVRDSVLHVPAGQTIDSLLNRPAPRLEGDYWFNWPAGVASPPVIPAAGSVSLLLFATELTRETATRLRQLHTQYPALQIVLVSMTEWRGERRGDVRAPTASAHDSARLAADHAERIAKRFAVAVQWPVPTVVLQTKYHSEPDASDIPLASPILDRFHLDPRAYAGHAFLVDAQGWLLDDRQGIILDGKLIHRLLCR